LRQALGSLNRIERMLRLGVFVHSSADFTRQSEVADAASDLLHEVFGSCGGHARTAVGVCQLPKNAAVEIELTVAIIV
jgi:enamine deaminase RidA (YjgF/YER057c/UK114 family)